MENKKDKKQSKKSPKGPSIRNRPATHSRCQWPQWLEALPGCAHLDLRSCPGAGTWSASTSVPAMHPCLLVHLCWSAPDQGIRHQ